MTANEDTGDSRKDLAESTDVEHQTDATGSGRAPIDPGSNVTGRLAMCDTVDDETAVQVVGHYYDDRAPKVATHINLGTADVTLTLSPARARELADELRLAATHAEQGAREAGWSE